MVPAWAGRSICEGISTHQSTDGPRSTNQLLAAVITSSPNVLFKVTPQHLPGVLLHRGDVLLIVNIELWSVTSVIIAFYNISDQFHVQIRKLFSFISCEVQITWPDWRFTLIIGSDVLLDEGNLKLHRVIDYVKKEN